MDKIKISKVNMDGGTQPRSSINQTVVEEFAADMRDGATFPPVIVFYDGDQYWLADGFHRVRAALMLGSSSIACDIHQGDRRAAVLYSCGANSSHGLRRTNEDKRRAVIVLLNDDEWLAWSDREIARRCGVHHDTVGKLRTSLAKTDSEPRTYTTKHGTTATMDTTNIGKRPKREPPKPRLTKAKRKRPGRFKDYQQFMTLEESIKAAVAEMRMLRIPAPNVSQARRACESLARSFQELAETIVG